MDINALKEFFLWCTIVNAALLLLISAMLFTPFADFSYRMNNKFFSITRPQFNVILVSFIALYKTVFIAFNLVPFIALAIVA